MGGGGDLVVQPIIITFNGGGDLVVKPIIITFNGGGDLVVSLSLLHTMGVVI